MRRLASLLLSMAMIVTPGVTAAAENVSQIIGDNNTVLFIDVPETCWAYSEIQYAASAGVVGGKPDGTFAPKDGVTREAFAKMMVLTFGASETRPEVPTFADVPVTKWSYGFVEEAKEYLTGYTSPFDSTKKTFQPTVMAKREDIAVALVSMMGSRARTRRTKTMPRTNFLTRAKFSRNYWAM